VKEKFKCPWCDTSFPKAKDLEEHAKKHYYIEEIEPIAAIV